MTETFALEPYRDGMAEVASAVFTTLLQLPIRQVPSPPVAAPCALTSVVYYTGEWNGALILQCGGAQAREWAARFMGLEPPIADEDSRDSLSELTNVVAGNLKALLPPGVILSLPSVIGGTDYRLSLGGRVLTESLCFEDDYDLFRLTLAEVIPSPRAAP